MEAMKQGTKWGASNQRNISHPHSSSAMIPSHCRFLIFETKRQFFQQSAFLSQRKLLVVTLLRSDRNTGGQQFLERPEMIRQPQSHGRRLLSIPTRSFLKREP